MAHCGHVSFDSVTANALGLNSLYASSVYGQHSFVNRPLQIASSIPRYDRLPSDGYNT